MSHVFHRQAKTVPRVAASGDGVYITDTEGNKFLDASGGAAVSCLGHSHPKVLQAIRDQIDAIPFAHTGFFTSKPAEDLADKLIETALRVANGRLTCAEALGHKEFVMTKLYRSA